MQGPRPPRLIFDPPAFDPKKLTVVYLNGAIPLEPLPLAARLYTLTHSDLTGQLLLSVGRQYNQGQLSGVQADPAGSCGSASPAAVDWCRRARLRTLCLFSVIITIAAQYMIAHR